MARVVTSDEAVQLIDRLLSDITQLRGQLDTMLRTGDELCTRDVWEGQAANRFGEEWQTTRTWAHTSADQLAELQDNVRMINQNIRDAGGDLG